MNLVTLPLQSLIERLDALNLLCIDRSYTIDDEWHFWQEMRDNVRRELRKRGYTHKVTNASHERAARYVQTSFDIANALSRESRA